MLSDTISDSIAVLRSGSVVCYVEWCDTLLNETKYYAQCGTYEPDMLNYVFTTLHNFRHSPQGLEQQHYVVQKLELVRKYLDSNHSQWGFWLSHQ